MILLLPVLLWERGGCRVGRIRQGLNRHGLCYLGVFLAVSSRRVKKKKMSNMLQVLKPAALTSSLGTGVHLRGEISKRRTPGSVMQKGNEPSMLQ